MRLILFVIIAGVLFGAGVVVGRYSAFDQVATDTQTSDAEARTVSGSAEVPSRATTTEEYVTEKVQNPMPLTEGQKKLLRAFGIDPNSVTLTAEMVACAEASLGTPRVEEIKSGATPTFSEGVKLYSCYKK